MFTLNKYFFVINIMHNANNLNVQKENANYKVIRYKIEK